MKTRFIYKIVAVVICFMTISTATMQAQQQAYTSIFEGTKAYWNPAGAGVLPYMKTDVWFRQQWLGFGSTAPRTGFIGFEYPFSDMNMAAGAMVTFDQTGPVSKKGLNLNYNYQLRGFLTEEGQLSLGIRAGFQQYAFSKDDVLFYDTNDQLLQANNTSTIYPTVGAGFYYMSTTDEYYDNMFYFGGSYNQIYTTDVLINQFNQKRENHIVFNIGSKIYSPDSFIEPSLTVNYTNPEFIDFIAAARYEMRNAFWAGIGYSSVSEVSVEGGVILDKFGGRYGQLRAGVIGNISISDEIGNFGPGAEIYISYRFENGGGRW